MASKPRKKRAKAPGISGRPSRGETKGVAFRVPPVVLEGVDRRAAREGLSRNDALIKAALDFGDYPEGRPKIMPEKPRAKAPPSVGARVETATREEEAPGARLDKASIGRRRGPAIAKTPVPAASAPAPEAI